jgi:hypothetical protein
MPVSLSSRYSGQPIFDASDAQGKTHPTIAIRPYVSPPPGTVVYNHILVGDEDMEYLAWRYFGSSSAWWQIADTNPLVFPLDPDSGSPVAIAGPGEVGFVQRTRSF